MENSLHLSIESFSYRWLVSRKPSMDLENSSLRSSIDVSDEASFIEMDPKKTPSKRFFKKSCDFKFDFPVSESPRDMVDADKLFSNGYVMPAFFISSKLGSSKVSDSSTAHPGAAPLDQNATMSPSKTRHPPLRKCCKFSMEMIQKYVDLLKPLVRRMRIHKSKTQPRRTNSSQAEEWKNRTQSSPRSRIASPGDDWRTSCDSDCSIYEAVLHKC